MSGLWVVVWAMTVPQPTIPRDDVRVGWKTIAGRQTHTHAFPEILYVVDGIIDGTHGEERYVAKAGTVLLIPPNTPSTLASPSRAELVYFQWAPGGDVFALHLPSTMIERADTDAATPALVDLRRYQTGPPVSERLRAHIDDVEWTTNFTYSEELWKVYRYKPLVRTSLADWGGISRDDVRMGLQELDPGAAYPAHHHPSPEVYVVLSGRARWTVGDQHVAAAPGTLIYTPPNAIHRIENAGDSRLRWLYFWWAPNGDAGVLAESENDD